MTRRLFSRGYDNKVVFMRIWYYDNEIVFMRL